MKQIIIDNKETPYFIDENGRLFSKKTNKYLKGSRDCGYWKYDLRFNGKKYEFKAHRLVAQYYLENPDNLPVVHHKDGNKLNNNVENLQWISYEDNAKTENKISIGKQSSWGEKVNYIEGEEWYQFRDSDYYCSNYGRVMCTKRNRLMRGSVKGNGYREIQIITDNKRHHVLAHRLIYEAINKIEIPAGYVINHIDGNKLNNNINNLEMVTYLDNNVRMSYQLDNNICKKVIQMDKEGNILRIYASAAEAARVNNIGKSSIQNACLKGRKTLGYLWQYQN